MKTLGIETSCDETAIAIYDSKDGIIGESVHSQMDMHAEYGGVVPELASRDHCLKIVDVLEDALGNFLLIVLIRLLIRLDQVCWELS